MIDNAFQVLLKDAPTTSYRLLKVLDNLADVNLNLRTFIIDICINGCSPFYQETMNDVSCSHCKVKRWNYCDEACNDHLKTRM